MRKEDHSPARARAIHVDAASFAQMVIAATITFFVGWLVGRLG
jgi:hypothetical protein